MFVSKGVRGHSSAKYEVSTCFFFKQHLSLGAEVGKCARLPAESISTFSLYMRVEDIILDTLLICQTCLHLALNTPGSRVHIQFLLSKNCLCIGEKINPHKFTL